MDAWQSRQRLSFWHLLQDRLDSVLIGALMRPYDGQLVYEGGQAYFRRPHHHRVSHGCGRMRALIQGINPLRMGVVLSPKKGHKSVPIGLLHGLWIRKRLEKCQRNRAGEIAKSTATLRGIIH